MKLSNRQRYAIAVTSWWAVFWIGSRVHFHGKDPDYMRLALRRYDYRRRQTPRHSS